MKGHLKDIILRLNTGHDRTWWTSPTSMTGGRMLRPIDFVADDLYGYFFFDHPENERWTYGIVRIAVGELRFGLSVGHLKELSELKKMLSTIAEDNEPRYNADFNGESFSSLQCKYSTRLLQFANKQRERIASLELTPNPDYSIKKISNFHEMQPYGAFTSPSSPWCVTYSEKKYNAFSANGSNSIFVLLHKDYKTIMEHTNRQGCEPYLKSIGRLAAPPYDDYGLSMLLLVIAPDGTLTYCTSRWNHSFTHSSHDYLNEWQISMLIGKDFYLSFK